MRKSIFSTMCMAVAIVFAASCNKIEEGITSVEGNGRTVITAVAEAVGGGTKAHNQYSYDVLWDKGDKIYVVGKENTNTFTDSVSGTQCVMKSTTFPDIARNTVGRITLSRLIQRQSSRWSPSREVHGRC